MIHYCYSLYLASCSSMVAILLALPVQDIPRLDDPKSAFLLICDSSPSKIILLDEAGRWMHRVKEIEVRIDGNSSVVKCTSYEGHYRPTSPDVRQFRLSQVKTVSESEFQAMINNLQTDPDAVRKSMAATGSDSSNQ